MSDSNGVLPVLALGIDSDQLDKDAKKAEERLRALAKAAETAEDQWDDFVTACEKAAEATQKYSNASAVAQRATAGTAEATKEAARQAQINALHIETFRKVVSELGLSQEELVQAMTRFQGASRPMQQAAASTAGEVKKLGDQADNAAKRVREFNSGMQSVGTPTGSFVRDVQNATGGLGRFGQGLVRATDDIGVFVRQVSSGQDAMTAFTVQLAQAAMAFGAGGFFVSMAASAALLAAQLLGSANAQEKLEKAIKGSEESFARATRAAADWRKGLEEEARQVQGLVTYYQNLDSARREYERRSLERTRRELEEKALSSSNDAIDPIRGLQGAIDRTNRLRAGSRGQLAPLNEQFGEVAELVRQFQELQRTDPAQALLNLAEGAQRAVREAGPLNAELQRLIEKIDGAVPTADRLSRQLALNAAQLQAVGGGSQGAAQGVTQVGAAAGGATAQVNTFAAGLGRALEALARLRDRSMVENPFASVNADITRLNQQLDALDRGGLAAYRRVLTEQERQTAVTQRATTLQAEFTRSLIETGASAEQAQQAAEELAPSFVQSAVTAVDAAQRITRRVQALEEAAKGASRAIRSMPDPRQTVYEPADQAGQTVFPVDVVNIMDRNNQRQIEADRRTNDQRLQNERRMLEDSIRQNERATDDVVRYAADRWAETWDENSRGFQGMLDSMKAAARNAFARMTAEAIIRPIVAPIVAGVGAGGGFGGDSSGSAGAGGSLGLSDLLGLGSSVNSLTGGGIGEWLGIGSVGSLLSAPVMGSSALAGATNTALAGMGGLYGPATASQVGAASGWGSAAGLGMTSWGSLLGAGGAGFGAGMLTNSLLGGNQTGGMIGSGLGTAAGMGLAMAFGGPIGLMGAAVLGGALGGGVGGMFGPGKGFSGGDALVGIGAGGMLEARGYAGKGFDQADQLMQQTAQQVAALNQQLQALGLSFDKALSSREWVAAVGGGESPNPTNLTDALRSRGVLGSLQSDDRRVNHSLAMANQRGAGLEGLLEVAQKAKTVAAAMDSLVAPVGAFEAQVHATRVQFQALIETARSVDLHGEADVLAQKMEEAVNDLLRKRWEGLEMASIDRQRRTLSTQDGDTEAGTLAIFDRQAALTISQLQDALRELGLWGADFEHVVAEERGALAAERAAIQRQFAERRQSVNNALADRHFAAGLDTSTMDGALAAYERAAMREREAAVKEGAANLAQLEATLAAERARIIADFEKRRLEAEQSIRQSLQDRIFALQNDTSTLAGTLAAYDRAAMREREEAVRDGLNNIAEMEALHAQERALIIEAFAKQTEERLRQMGGSIRSFIDAVKIGRAGGYGSPSDQFAAAQQVFGADLALARNNDEDALGRITGSADALLATGRQMYGSAPEFQALKQWVLSNLEGLPATKNYDALILAELQKLGGAIQVEVFTTLAQTLRLAVEGSTVLTEDQKTILLATTARVEHILQLKVEGAAGLSASQQAILDVESEAILRSLLFSVTGSTALTGGQREILTISAASLSRVLQILVTGDGAFTPGEREIIATEAATLIHALQLAVTGRAGLTDAQREIIETAAANITHTLQLLITGATTLSAGQQEILAVAAASVTRSLALLVSGATALTGGQREILTVAAASIARTLQLIVTGESGLTTQEREIAAATAATVTRTLSLVVSGAAGLTEAQKEIATATTASAVRTLELLVTGQTAGLTTAQKQIAFAVTAEASRTLELLVLGSTGLTEQQREVLMVATATVTRTLQLIISGEAGLTTAEREIALMTTASVSRSLALVVSGAAGLSNAQREIATATTAAATRTLSLLVTGQTAGLNSAQKQIAYALTAEATRTLELIVTGAAGLSDAQREVALMGTRLATRTLELLVTGVGGLTDAQKEIAFATTASFSRTLNLAVTEGAMPSELRKLLLEVSVPFQRALELGIELTGVDPTLRTALLNDLGVVSRTLALAASGGVLTTDQRALLEAKQETVQRTLSLLASSPTLTAEQREILNVVSGEIRSLTLKQAVETTETVQISRSIDDKLSGIMTTINRGLLTLIAVNQGGFASVARSAASNSYVSPGNALQQSGLMPGSDGNNADFVKLMYRSILRREADASGLSYYQGLLDSGQFSRGTIYDFFVRSVGAWQTGFAGGGWVGNGLWNRDSVVASFAGGGNIGLAGGEHITNAPMAARYAPELNSINAGTYARNDNSALVAELRSVRAELAALRAERAADSRRIANANERTADAAETTAVETKRMARRGPPVGARAVAS